MSLIEPAVGLAPPQRDEGSERRRALRFAGLFTALFVLSGAFKLHRGGSRPVAIGLIVSGVAFLGYALVHPAGALALRRRWMQLAEVLGRINSAILLGVLYLLVVTPLGLALRVFSRRTGKDEPYFVSRHEQRDAKHFEHPY
ncbi:MAG TPA: SxtJ family membrane protein [Polyangiaceae bacterium]|jgi:hypothetical protein|nr:SxtJ family membrane protein [Polyangiaceae bacterium]